ncbi:MAG: GntR family transcriptional regulator [Bacilli bacterium]|nr:GntR family transcriptional regulator [Bacilli bacterium]
MFSIDFQSRIPIYEQIVNQVERFIVCGVLKSGEQLPSVRQMAFDLGANPNTIQRAYTELERMGIIVSVIGKGSFVTQNVSFLVERKIDNIINETKDNIMTLKNMGLTDKEIKEKLLKD